MRSRIGYTGGGQESSFGLIGALWPGEKGIGARDFDWRGAPTAVVARRARVRPRARSLVPALMVFNIYPLSLGESLVESSSRALACFDYTADTSKVGE